MAYASQDLKKKVAPLVKTILDQYGLKGSLSINNHLTLVLTIKTGDLFWELDEKCNDVNTYHLGASFTGKELECLTELKDALNLDNYDNSDIQTDYFDVGHYIAITIGKWDKPYKYTGAPRAFPNGFTVERSQGNSFAETVTIKQNGEIFCKIEREEYPPYNY
jgi:hypothetical protein